MKWILAFVLLGTGLALAQDITNGLSNPKQVMKNNLNNPTGVIAGGGGGGGSTQNPLPIGMP